MKRAYILVVFFFFSYIVSAQAPQGFNYQGVVRDATGGVLDNESVTLIISIIQGTVDGIEIFSETHTGSTNDFGLINLKIGSINSTDFGQISWQNGPYFIKITLNGNPMGVTQILSVPFALHANTVENIDETQTLADVLSLGADAGNNTITNLGAPNNDNDAVNKAYVEGKFDEINTHELSLAIAQGADLSVLIASEYYSIEELISAGAAIDSLIKYGATAQELYDANVSTHEAIKGKLIDWEESYGTSEGDYAYSTAISADKKIYIAGYSYGTSLQDMVVLKYDTLGSIIWSKEIVGNSVDVLYDIISTPDNGCIAVGATLSESGDIQSSNSGSYDVAIVKLTPDGIIEWTKTYGGNYNDQAKAICSLSDGNYAVTGITNSISGTITVSTGTDYDGFIIKIDPTGSLLWANSYGGSNTESLNEIIEDGTYIFAVGWSRSSDISLPGNNGGQDIWILKTDISGAIIWSQNIGSSQNDEGNSIASNSDGSISISGYRGVDDEDFTGLGYSNMDAFLIKLDQLGAIVWKKVYPGGHDDICNSHVTSTIGGFMLTGRSYNSSTGVFYDGKGVSDIFVLKADENGDLEWTKQFGGSQTDFGLDIVELNEGEYIVVGHTQSDDGDISTFYGDTDVWVFKTLPFSLNK